MAKTEFVNAYIGHKDAPTEAELASILGASLPLWRAVVDALNARGITSCEWHSYSVKAGWSYRAKRRDRTIAYLLPHAGGFQVALVFGDKAIAFMREQKFPKRVLDLLDAAKRYAEGTGIRIALTKEADVALIDRLVEVKLAH